SNGSPNQKTGPDFPKLLSRGVVGPGRPWPRVGRLSPPPMSLEGISRRHPALVCRAHYHRTSAFGTVEWALQDGRQDGLTDAMRQATPTLVTDSKRSSSAPPPSESDGREPAYEERADRDKEDRERRRLERLLPEVIKRVVEAGVG